MEITERENKEKIEEMRKAIEDLVGKTVMTAIEMSFTTIYDIDAWTIDLEQIEKIQNVLKTFDWKAVNLRIYKNKLSLTIQKRLE